MQGVLFYQTNDGIRYCGYACLRMFFSSYNSMETPNSRNFWDMNYIDIWQDAMCGFWSKGGLNIFLCQQYRIDCHAWMGIVSITRVYWIFFLNTLSVEEWITANNYTCGRGLYGHIYIWSICGTQLYNVLHGVFLVRHIEISIRLELRF